MNILKHLIKLFDRFTVGEKTVGEEKPIEGVGKATIVAAPVREEIGVD